MPDGPDEIAIDELEGGGISLDTDFDKQAEELLELEAKLSSIPGAEIDPDERYESGMVVGAERVLFDDVPDTYPTDIDSLYALCLDVQLSSGRKTAVCLPWPDQITDDTELTRLLAAIDIPVHSFADILGREIPLKRDRSHYVVNLDDDQSNGSTVDDRESIEERSTADSMDDSDATSNLPSPYWHYVVIGCVISWMIVWVALNDITAGLALVVEGVFPLAIYFDSKYVRARSTWSPHKWLWPILSLIWVINIPAGIAYLAKRNQAEFSDV